MFLTGPAHRLYKEHDRPEGRLCVNVVAGARYVVEKKIPGLRIDFQWLEDLCLPTGHKVILSAAA